MRVYVPSAANLSRAMTRVEQALIRYYPRRVTISSVRRKANVVVLHAVGYPDTLEHAQQCWDRGQQVVLIQYCFRSTQKPNAVDWLPLWERALMTFSYYDLHKLAAEDGVDTGKCNFYRAPLGVDPHVFQVPARHVVKRYAIMTSGYVAETEAAKECAVAAAKWGKQTFHLGPNLGLGLNVVSRFGLLDRELVDVYHECEYVAGLRRVEGFEMPAAEGAVCGTRPILFDRPHYRDYHSQWGRFIPEGDFDTVVAALRVLFESDPDPMSREEILAARKLFDWSSIATGFWEHVR